MYVSIPRPKGLLALAVSGVFAGPVFAQESATFPDWLKIRGFGTAGVVHSDDSRADYVGGVNEPNGVGRTRNPGFDTDSRLGVQADMALGKKWSATVQVVADRNYDNSWKPEIEWANVKWELTPSLSLRAGRFALPAFIVSDYRKVGYGYTWARPPIEVYSQMVFFNLDGVDALYKLEAGGVSYALQGFYGRAGVKIPTADVKGSPAWGGNVTAELGELTLRAGYVSADLLYENPSLQTLHGAINGFAASANQFGFATAANQALAYVDQYGLDVYTNKRDASFIELGATYDAGKWFVTGEVTQRKADAVGLDSSAWYLTGGARFGKFTPYVTYAERKSEANYNVTPISTAGMPPVLAAGAGGISAAVSGAMKFNDQRQKSVSGGVRWDFAKNFAAKVQYDRIQTGTGSRGLFTNGTPDFLQGGATVGVTSLLIDFVF